MAGVQRIECATLRVEDRQASAEFYSNIMGLVELERDNDHTFFGCGMDGNYDLAITEGGTGLEDVSFRLVDDELEQSIQRLQRNDVEFEHRTRPGQKEGIYFDLPSSGTSIGLVVVEDDRYKHPADATHFLDSVAPINDQRSPVAPLDLDHIGLISPDIETDQRFLEEVLDFTLSDAKVGENGEWINAFTRAGNHYHHDISFFSLSPEYNLHHLAWTMRDMSQMKLFADQLSRAGEQLELGFVRHGPGGNISMYFQEPGGNRFEYATEVSTTDAETPAGIYDSSQRPSDEGISLWGGVTRPDSFAEGS